MVDEALSAARAVQQRVRDLPSRVVIYLILAGCLFPEVGYPGVWRKLTGALAGLPVAAPTASALSQARRRVGAKPLRWLFDLLRGPAATPHGPGARWRGLLVVALDGTTLTSCWPTATSPPKGCCPASPPLEAKSWSGSRAAAGRRSWPATPTVAAGVIAGTVIDLAGTIGRHVLAALLPSRRLRVSPRIVKRAISKYQARGPRIDRTSYKATTSIDILAPQAP
ncbi:hypothetical protein JCM4914_34920 [Streptomyces platensis subsp. malvinus]